MSAFPSFRRAGGRFLSRLASRIAGVSIPLDYPVWPHPRWGAAWNLKAHQQLTRLIRAGDVSTQAALSTVLDQTDALRRIRARPAGDPSVPCWVNGFLPGLDGACLYAFVAASNPRLYLEVGSGHSTKFVRRAITDHGLQTRIISIDPSPRTEIDALCDEVIRQPLEDSDLSVFDRLSAGDICFVDDSHRCFQNSDVTVMFLEVIPRLASGVLIGFHDIFLPDDYPAAWTGRFYNEQYLLAAFLLGGHAGTTIVLPAWDASRRPDLAALLAPLWEGADFAEVERHGNGFWLRTETPSPA